MTAERKLPCGRPVHALPSAGSPTAEIDHSEQAVAERIAWQRERFPVGTIIRRDDGCTIRIMACGEPSVGGYHTGSLTKVEIVALPGTLPDFDWRPMTEAEYERRFNVLPPAGMRHRMFLLGEPTDNNGEGFAARYYPHCEWDGQCWVGSRPVTRAEFARL